MVVWYEKNSAREDDFELLSFENLAELFPRSAVSYLYPIIAVFIILKRRARWMSSLLLFQCFTATFVLLNLVEFLSPRIGDLVTEIVHPEGAETILIPKPHTRRRPLIPPTPGGGPSSHLLQLLRTTLVALPVLLSPFFMYLKRYYSTVVGLD